MEIGECYVRLIRCDDCGITVESSTALLLNTKGVSPEVQNVLMSLKRQQRDTITANIVGS